MNYRNRSLALVSIQRLAAVVSAKALHLRDFWSLAIFEFFNAELCCVLVLDRFKPGDSMSTGTNEKRTAWPPT